MQKNREKKVTLAKKLIYTQHIYEALSKSGIYVFVEYPEVDDKALAEKIYVRLDLDGAAGICPPASSAIAYLPFSQFLSVHFLSEDEALKYTNSFDNEEDRKMYRAFMYVNGVPVHESV